MQYADFKKPLQLTDKLQAVGAVVCGSEGRTFVKVRINDPQMVTAQMLVGTNEIFFGYSPRDRRFNDVFYKTLDPFCDLRPSKRVRRKLKRLVGMHLPAACNPS